MERGGEESVQQLPFVDRHRGKLWLFGIVIGYCAIFGLPSLKFLFWASLFLIYNIGNIVARQEQILYPAQKGPNARNPVLLRSPKEWRMPFESVRLLSKGDGPDAPPVRIHCWFIHHGAETKRHPTLVYFHGNAGNLGNRCPLYHQLYYHSGVNILAVEYRGYGESGGEPTEAGLRADARAALAYLATRPDVDQSSIFLFGSSLGGAVATALAAEAAEHEERRRKGEVPAVEVTADGGAGSSSGGGEQLVLLPPVRGLILENTFTAVAELALQLIWLLRLFVCLTPRVVDRWFLRSHWRTIDSLGRVRCPILFLSGLRDEIVPPAQMRQLAEVSRARQLHPAERYTRFITFPDGTHNDTSLKGGRRYYGEIRRFIIEQLEHGSEARKSVQALEEELSSAAAAAPSSSSGGGDPDPRTAGDLVLQAILAGQQPPVAALRVLLGADVYADVIREAAAAQQHDLKEKEEAKGEQQQQQQDSGVGIGLAEQRQEGAPSRRRRSSAAAAAAIPGNAEAPAPEQEFPMA